MNQNPKHYQAERFLIEFEERRSKGPISPKTPEELISTAETYSETDILRSWYLRQATFEYLLKYLKEDDELAHQETITLLSAILGGDALLATEIIDAIAQK